jgi:hypothetical protein
LEKKSPYLTHFISLPVQAKICPHYVRKNKKATDYQWLLVNFVGVAGFEPAASCSQSRRDTGLRYTPMVSLYEDAKVKNKYTFQNLLQIFFQRLNLST